MGRQPVVALSEEDEDDFLGFLRADSDIRIYQRAASTPELLVVPKFPPRGPSESSYRLWNAAFPWEPEYGQWQREDVTPELAGKFYLKNTARTTARVFAPELQRTEATRARQSLLEHGLRNLQRT